MKKLTRREMLKLMGLTAAGTVLAACQPQATAEPTAAGEEMSTEAPATEVPKGEPVKVIMVESWFGLPQDQTVLEPVNAAISEKMQSEGVNIEIQSMVLDDHATKYPVLYASGANFTMAFDAPWYKMNSLRDQGALLVLEDMIASDGPVVLDSITQRIMDFNYMLGHIYGLPIGFFYSGDTGVVYREDLREKYGVAAPTSEVGYRSLEPYLEAIAKNEPGMIPFANITDYPPSTQNVTLRRSWGQGADKTGLLIKDCTADWTYEDMETIPEVVDAATMLREWWEKDWINKSDLIVSGSTQTVPNDYFFPGKCASFQENEPAQKAFEIFQKPTEQAIPGAIVKGADMSGMSAGRVKGVGLLKQWNFIVFNSSAKPESSTAGMQFFNWMYGSQDNMDMWLLGIEGTNWKKEDNMRFSEIEGVDNVRNYRKQWYVAGVPGKFARLPKDMPPEAEAAVKYFSTESNWDFNPHEKFEADTKALEVELATLQAAWEEANHGLATGQVATEEAIATFKKTLDDAGRQQFKEKLQKQLNDYIAANK